MSTSSPLLNYASLLLPTFSEIKRNHLFFFFSPPLWPSIHARHRKPATLIALSSSLSGRPPVTHHFNKVFRHTKTSYSLKNIAKKLVAMKGLSKLGISLTVVFAVCVIVLIIDILYVLWRRRGFCRSSSDVECHEEQLYSPSKELLYFCCWKSQTRVEPDAVPKQTESDDDELARWEKLHGPSRMLFTIKEEEREEDEADHNRCYEEENDVREVPVRLEDVVVEVPADVADSMPFSTPCASPPYYTPSPSPSHGMENITAVGNVV